MLQALDPFVRARFYYSPDEPVSGVPTPTAPASAAAPAAATPTAAADPLAGLPKEHREILQAALALPEDQRRLFANPDAFKKRLGDERGTATRALLQELGVENTEGLKALVADAKKLSDEKKTELERRDGRIKDLEPKAKEAERLGKAVSAYLTAEEAAIPEDKKALLALAPEATDPVARLEWIVKAKAQGLFAPPPAPVAAAPAAAPAAAAAAPVVPPKPATTIAPPGPTTPAPAGTLNKYQIYQGLIERGQTLAAANFMNLNRTEIELHRPK